MKKVMVILTLFMVTLLNLGSEHHLSDREAESMRSGLILQSKIVKIRGSEFSPGLFWEYINIIGIKSPDIVYSQSVLETGWFRHVRCTRYGNYFGMKPAMVRDHTQAGEWKSHATYNHWTYSVDDYKLWQDYWHSIGYSQADYYRFLDKIGYAEARAYIRILKSINSGHGPPLT